MADFCQKDRFLWIRKAPLGVRFFFETFEPIPMEKPEFPPKKDTTSRAADPGQPTQHSTGPLSAVLKSRGNKGPDGANLSVLLYQRRFPPRRQKQTMRGSPLLVAGTGDKASIIAEPRSHPSDSSIRALQFICTYSFTLSQAVPSHRVLIHIALGGGGPPPPVGSHLEVFEIGFVRTFSISGA